MGIEQNKKGKLVIVSGPSGVGKSTICREIIASLENVCSSVSVTTRPRAKEEIDGKEYWFVTKEQFQQRIDEGLLLEHAEVFGNLYGTPKDKVDQALESGKTVILEIDVQGAKQVKAMCTEAVTIFILPPAHKDLKERLSFRGREDTETAEKRLNKANSEIAIAKQCYEHMVINDNLQQAVNEVIQIIQQNTGGKEC